MVIPLSEATGKMRMISAAIDDWFPYLLIFFD